MPQLRNVDDQMAVFVSPTSLTFYADDLSTHKRILSVFNPYQIDLKYQVLSTDRKKYSVSESEGIITPNHKVDIVLHHKAVTPINIGAIDKIRVQLFHTHQAHRRGQRDITVTLLATKPDVSTSSRALDTERFEPLSSESASPTPVGRFSFPSHPERSNLAVIMIIISAIIALIALMFPNEGLIYEMIPSYFHPGSGVKLFAAYFLGMATVAIFRT